MQYTTTCEVIFDHFVKLEIFSVTLSVPMAHFAVVANGVSTLPFSLCLSLSLSLNNYRAT